MENTPPNPNSGNPQQNPIPPYTPQPPRPKKKTDPVTGAIAIVSLGLAIWFFFADIPPVPQLISWQASMFDGSYYPKLTILLTIIIIALPLILIWKLIQMSMKK
ncbi:MAG TPA: hypothetical protein VL651_02100 [Bacteroidia bacterium]|jgi:hypothetical protein|nr:hypothetical protein [Bacteroidia bacterium]